MKHIFKVQNTSGAPEDIWPIAEYVIDLKEDANIKQITAKVNASLAAQSGYEAWENPYWVSIQPVKTLVSQVNLAVLTKLAVDAVKKHEEE